MIESNEHGYIHHRDNGEIHLTVVLSKEDAATCNCGGELIYRSDIMDMIRTRATSLGHKLKTKYVGPVMPMELGTKMPSWAKWWACHADGEAFWYECQPFRDVDARAWGFTFGRTSFAGHMPPPDDWGSTLREVNDQKRESPHE